MKNTMMRALLKGTLAVFLCAVLCFQLTEPAVHAELIQKPAVTAKDTDIYETDAVDTGVGDKQDNPAAVPSMPEAAADADPDIEVFRNKTVEINDDTIIDELTEKREINAKHFRLTDGSRTAVVYGFPIHEDDGTGKLIEIDNTLRPVTEGGVNKYIQESKSRQTTFFTEPEDGRLFYV